MKISSRRISLFFICVTIGTHVFSAARSNYLVARYNLPQSAPFWFAWVMPAPITFYVGVLGIAVVVSSFALTHWARR